MNTDDIEALALAELRARVLDRYDTVRAVAGQTLDDGDKRTVRSPLGDMLGVVSRSDPDPRWAVTDREALCAHLYDEVPGSVETVYEVAGPVTEVIAVLRVHAPHLLAEVTRVRAVAVDRALAAAAAGDTAAPGIELVKPAGSVSVRRAKGCGAAIERMQRVGLLTWDGRPQLPPAEEPAP